MPNRKKNTSPTADFMFEIMDTTLRDGEQTEGVSLITEEKLTIAKALIESVKVDRLEVASARVSKGELKTVAAICDWAKRKKELQRVEILGFVDHKASIDWACQCGCKVINLLTKGSRKHCEMQLGKTLAQHLKDIEKTLQYGSDQAVKFNIYLEDWSGGMLNSPDYVLEMLDAVVAMPFLRIMLPDTLGLLDPTQVFDFVSQMTERHPEAHYDFHAHNDYGLGTANSLEALMAGVRGLHTTINGLGERTGNAPMDEVVVAARDFTAFRSNIDEKKIYEISRLTEVFTGKRVAWNKPLCGEDVFTQTAGIHADGDKKGNLYSSRLTPSRFGRSRTYAMGKLMGKANLDFNLNKLGIDLSADQKKLVLARVIELGDAKKAITTEDLPYIISDVLQTPGSRVFEVVDFMIVTNKGLQPAASVLVAYKGKQYQATASGDGGYDAFMKALRTLEKHLDFKIPTLADYSLRIPPGGKTDALVEATITWKGGMKTRGVNSDQLVAAVEATTHAINQVAVNCNKKSATDPKAKAKPGAKAE